MNIRLLSVIILLALVILVPSPSPARERQAEITFSVRLNAPETAKAVRLWIPYPMSDENQEITDVRISGNYSYMGIHREGEHGNAALYAEWKEPSRDRTLVYSFLAKRKETAAVFPRREGNLSKEEFGKYLVSTPRIPTDGRVKELAVKITKGKKTVRAKARAIYDWIVDNMRRDPSVKGCGLGEVEKLLGTRGGKCIDLHSVFVSLARAAGLPAREVMGIRIPKGKEGDMTKTQGCGAEFYQPGYGWVYVNPAYVTKMVLEGKLTAEQSKLYRDYYFGSADESIVSFGQGRDIVLNPPQSGAPLNYFMYPYAEADGKALNEDLYGYNIGYNMTFREL